METHSEDDKVWRVLRVTFPADAPTHCNAQTFYFGADGLLKRIDHVTDVAGGIASHGTVGLTNMKWAAG